MATILPYRKDDPQRRINPNQISISGLTGCGKSTCFNDLRRRLGEGFHYLSVGEIMRRFSDEQGFPSVREFAAYNRAHPEKGFDRKCDGRVAEAAMIHPNLVCEGRLPHYFMRDGEVDCFHILVFCPTMVRIARRMRQRSFTLDEAQADVEGRDADDLARYSALYPASIWPDECFDLVVDTEKNDPSRAGDLIMEGYMRWLAENHERVVFEPVRVWVSV